MASDRAPVAQRIRAMGFYPTGRGFESSPGRQIYKPKLAKPMPAEFRQRLFRMVSTSETLAGRLFDQFIVSLIIVNVAAMVLETLPGVDQDPLLAIEVFSVIIFSLEIALRVYVADLLYPDLSPARARWKYFFSPMAIVDTLAVIYFYLPFIFRLDLRSLRALRLLRLFKVVKISRHSETIHRLGRVIKDQARTLLATTGAILFVVMLSASLVYNAEAQAGSGIFASIPDAIWWGMKVLVAGEGGTEPTTVVGRVVSLIIAMAGIALIAVPTGIITAEFLDEIERDKKAAKPGQKPAGTCRHCGRDK